MIDTIITGLFGISSKLLNRIPVYFYRRGLKKNLRSIAASPREKFPLLNSVVNLEKLFINPCAGFSPRYLSSDKNTAFPLIHSKLQNSIPILILGDFGSGKSWLLRQMTKSFLEEYKTRPRKSMFPIYVDLATYSEFPDLDALIESEMTNLFGSKNLRKKRVLITESLETGNYIFFLDGFDELAKGAPEHKLISGLIQWGSSIAKKWNKCRFIVAGRSSLFRSDSSIKKIEKAGFSIIYLHQWDNSQITEYLKIAFDLHLLTDPPDRILKKLDELYCLEVASRPLLLSMIVQTWSDIKTKDKLDIPSIYEQYVRSWILEWQELRIVSPLSIEEIENYMGDLALEMFRSGKGNTTASELEDQLSKKFKIEKFSESMENFSRDVRTNALLVREGKHFVFCHLSMMEYLVAVGLIHALEKNDSKPFLVPREAYRYLAIEETFLTPMLVKRNISDYILRILPKEED